MSSAPALAEDDLVGRFWRLTSLNILANVTVPLAGLVDAAMLGHLPEVRFLAGTALGAIIFDFIFWSFGFLRMATTGVAAQAKGRGDQQELYSVLARSALLALVAGGLLLLLRNHLGDAAFQMMSGDAGTEAAARDYFSARIWGAPAALLNLVFLGWFLGREESRVALVMTVAASVSNILLNFWFIMHLGWAARGAGMATMISQYIMLAVALGFYARRHVAWDLSRFRDVARWLGMVRLQRDILLRTLCLVTTFALFTDFSARFGTEVLAANTLLLRIVTLAAWCIDGAAFATESLAGVLSGGRRAQALRRIVRLALLSAFAFAGALVLPMLLWPSTLLGWLTVHQGVIQLGIEFRWWLIPVLLIGSAAYIYDGLFLGLTAGRALRNSMLFSALLGFAPLAWLALEQRLPHLLWAALALFMLARTLTLGWASRPLLENLENSANDDR